MVMNVLSLFPVICIYIYISRCTLPSWRAARSIQLGHTMLKKINKTEYMNITQ